MPVRTSHQSCISEINNLISMILKLEDQIATAAQSETTTAMVQVLEELKKMIVDVRETYDGVYNGKPINYTRKYPIQMKILGIPTFTVEQAIEDSLIENEELKSRLDQYEYKYTIQPGDTLSELAKKYKTTVDEIIKYNPGIKDPNLIYAGASLIIPVTLSETIAGKLFMPPYNIRGIRLNSPTQETGTGQKASESSSKNNPQSSPSTPNNATQSKTQNGNFTVTKVGDKTVSQYNVKTQNQNEAKYKSSSYFNYQEKGYGKSSISQSGCGPSSFATLINALNGKEITNPEEMCRYSLDHNARQHGAGTSMHDLMRAWCKEHPEYHYEQLYSSYSDPSTKKAEALQKLYSALKEGKVAAIGNRPGYFTNNDHIVAVTGIEDNGGKIRLIISDPNYTETKWNRIKGAELIGDKVYVEPEAAMDCIASIRLFYK